MIKSTFLIAALLVAFSPFLTAAPAIQSGALLPATPTDADAVTVTARVTPSAGASLSQVQLTWSSALNTPAPIFRESMGRVTNNNWTGTGTLNSWTVTASPGPADAKQQANNSNHTAPLTLTSGTTDGSTKVTCASTSGLWPGMILTGPNIAAGATVASVANSTTFYLSTPATGLGTGLSLTAAGVTLVNCTTTTGSATVSCASTVGLTLGMGISGAVANPAPTVAQVVDATTFLLSSNVTAGAAGVTLVASGTALEFSTGANTMATTSTALNTAGGSAGYVEFYVRTSDLVSGNGWTFQISPDGGTTWNTRLSENYAANTVSLTGATLNGTTTVTCGSTAGLAAGMTVQGAALRLTGCGTTSGSATVTCAATGTLAAGMYVTGNGIAPNTRVATVTANSAFTLSANATATATGIGVLANYLNANTTIASVTNGTAFVLSATPVYTGTGLALDATTVNHPFSLKHYDLGAADRTANMKLRFQFSGSTAVNPARSPVCDIDDVVVAMSSSTAPATLTMYDDGLHGDGVAGDGVYGATLPVLPAGTLVTAAVSATDTTAASTTGSALTWTVAVPSPVLAVTPSSSFSAFGNLGGSFSPASRTYTIANSGTGAMNWSARKSAAWLNLSPTGGTLAAGASIQVTASLTASTGSLPAGSYGDTLTFLNTSNDAGDTTRAASLSIYTTPAAPVLPPLATYTRGTTQKVTWAAVPGATSYTLEISASPQFTSLLSTQTISDPSGSFLNLTEGATYYYRVVAGNSAGTSVYSNVVLATPDATPPAVSIASPVSGLSTAATSIVVTGTASDALAGVTGVTINGAPVTTTNNFATWTATVPLAFGTNPISAIATDAAGNFTTSAPVLIACTTSQTYNPLHIPNTITGTEFNLTLNQATKQFQTGPATTTYSYNNELFWGPTLIMNQGDTVQMHVTNNLIDTTTTHWHGFHIPAIMDGGPHQTVPPGTTWSPSWVVRNNAATFWYHPHLHTTTQQQLTLGAGGLIIVRDPQEAALNLPRTYGVDDIPVVLTSRRFQTAAPNVNQFVTANSDYGDYMLVNGTLRAQVSLPAQYVRLRVLNAETERAHYLGFSDNRTFYVIGTDGGLVNAPIPLTRARIDVGERLEILVNFTGTTPGTALDLMSYNSNQGPGFPGGQTGTGGTLGSLLNNIDFVDLHLNVVAQNANPVTSMPSTLANNVYWTAADVTNSRTITISGGQTGPLFPIDNQFYSPSVINQTVNLNAVEAWTINNTSIFSHSFHIHDIQFCIVSRTNNEVVQPWERGWKDTLRLQTNSSTTFITKFDTFASYSNPFMYHCHFLEHEDAGTMAQFLVVNNAVEDLAVSSFTRTGANPTVTLQFRTTPGTTYTLQYSPDMTTSSWKDIATVTSDGAAAVFYETDPGRLAQARGFYRVAMPVISQ